MQGAAPLLGTSLGMDTQPQGGRREFGERSPFLKETLPLPKQGPRDAAQDLGHAPRLSQKGAEVFSFDAWAIRDRLRGALEETFEQTPLEDGFSNPAESILARTMDIYPQSGPRWIREWVLSENDSEFGRDILICLSRALARPIPGWALELAGEALSSPRIRLRYAGVRALELWGGTAATRSLERHSEPVAWLAQYARSAALDMRGQSKDALPR